MTQEQMALWVLERVVVPGLSALAVGLFAVRRLRRTIRVQRLTKDEMKAYDDVLRDLKLLRKNAAAILRDHQYRENNPLVNDWSEMEARDTKLERESRQAFERIRDAEAIGAIELSEGAVEVLREFIAEKDAPDRSDSDGVYYEEDAFTERCIRDFRDARLVAMGEMWGTTWWLHRKVRAARAGVATWWHQWKERRYLRRTAHQYEDQRRRLQAMRQSKPPSDGLPRRS